MRTILLASATVALLWPQRRSSIRVVVASHIRLYREGLERVLRESPEFTLVGNAEAASEVIEQTRKPGADVALLDTAMTGAFSVAKEVARRGGPGKIVALVMPEEEMSLLSCTHDGIAEHVPCDGSVEDVVAAIKAAAKCDVPCSPQTARSLVKRKATVSMEQSRGSGNLALTTRKTQILKLVQEGMSNTMISYALSSGRLRYTGTQRHMRTPGIVVGNPQFQDASQMGLRQGDQPIEALATDGPDRAFTDCTCHRAAWR